jgi:hypothetical protein
MSFQLKRELPARAKMLWASVLRRAVFDYVLYKGVARKQREWQYAYQYIFIKDQEYENGLSFEQVCDIFGWHPDYLRRMATQLTRADIKRLEVSSFKDELTQEAVECVVKKVSRWKTSKFATPFYPKMLDDFTPGVKTVRIEKVELCRYVGLPTVTPIKGNVKTVRKEILTTNPPLVQWQVATA